MEIISAKIPLLASNIATQLINELAADFPKLDQKLDKDMITQIMHDYAVSNISKPIELSFVRPDFEGIKMQLIAKLRESNAWKDIIQAAGGETILEFVAAIGSYAQLSIQRSLQEGMLDTARLKSSVYTITRMLGVHIRRKTPAVVTVRLTNNDLDNPVMMIPRYSQFMVGSVKCFNRENIVFSRNNPEVDVPLYQGEIVIEEMVSTGRPFQRWEVGDNDFAVADLDILCIDSRYQSYDRVEDGLWHYPGEKAVFYENTTPNGNVECLFGNGSYGRIPPVGETLKILYARTLGEEANSTLIEQSVLITAVNDVVPDRIRRDTVEAEAAERQRVAASVRGVTLSTMDSGAPERDMEFYRAMAPSIFAAKGRAVTRKDHQAVALDCPHVPLLDVYFQGQQELNPQSRNYINVVGVTTLKKNGEPLTPQEWKRFMAWFEDRAIWRCQYMHIEPQPVDIDIDATIYCAANSDPPKVRSYIEYRLMEAFAIRRGWLGYSMYLSDIYEILEAKHHSLKVDYATLTNPANDYVISNTEFIRLNKVNINVEYTGRYFSTYLPNKPRGSLIVN